MRAACRPKRPTCADGSPSCWMPSETLTAPFMAGRTSSGGRAARRRRLFIVTAARDYDDLHDLVDRLTPRQAERLRVLVSSDPDLASATQPQGEQHGRQRVSIIGIWESGRGDLSERHDEIIRERLKHSA